ncbi:hypothetical protein ACLOJK_023627 [Asimina triloba]
MASASLLFLSLSLLLLLPLPALSSANSSPKPTHISFSLKPRPLSPSSSPLLLSSLSSTPTPKPKPKPKTSQISKIPGNNNNPPALTSKIPFKYTMALVVDLPIGTPPQSQPMVLDTGSQLSWIQCKPKTIPKMPSFDPSLSSTFSLLPCNTPLCKPRVPDFSLPTSCDANRLCHYSYFYADGTVAEGNLVREKISLPDSHPTPPIILGCSRDASSAEGILGMNLGRLSFASQAKIRKFSYCVPSRRRGAAAVGTFLIGDNPSAASFRYVPMSLFGSDDRRPNLDRAAYTVGMQGIRIGGRRLNISGAAFRPDPSGAGQTMVDSGTEFTFLVEAAYARVREEVARRVGPTRVKKGYTYGGGALDLCVDGVHVVEIWSSVGEMVLEMDGGVEMVVGRQELWAPVGGGVWCLSVGSSEMLGVESNIIGNFHQQNMWVEFDLLKRRVGFGKAGDCSKPAV